MSEDDRGEAGAQSVRPGLSEAELYVVIREAVEDAILGVLGTVLLVGIAFLLGFAGLSAMARGATGGQPAIAVGGFLLGAFGLYLAAATLEVVPPIREWFRRSGEGR